MIIVMRPATTDEEVQRVVETIHELGNREHVSRGNETTIIGMIGDERVVDEARFMALPGVAKVMRVLTPYRLASRQFHPDDSVVKIGKRELGGKHFAVMAGPCAVESEEQLLKTARHIAPGGASVLRGGAFKPRSSPYSFQGLGIEGLRHLAKAREETGLSVVTEVMSVTEAAVVGRYADILQIGARNMQNFRLLETVGRQEKPVLLKRGLMSTVEEFLLAAEYVMNCGNPNVILCERGIRTFEKETRNTLDLSAVAAVKKKSHLPIVVDPSHSTGKRDYVVPMARAAVAAGADGIIVEVHPDPEKALSDGPQSLTFDQFDDMMKVIRPLVEVMGKTLTT
jgi:3-deoxy-7-phosphoheptulonate synthase